MDNELSVRTLMSSPAITISERAALDEARERMEEHRIRHLPVVGSDGKLLGMVSDRDVSRALDMSRTSRGRRPSLRIGDVMQRDVLTIDADRPAQDAARSLAEEQIGALPVLDGDRLAGMITSSDFLAMAAESLSVRATSAGAARKPEVSLASLLVEAFAQAPAEDATKSIEAAREQIAREGHVGGFSLEVVAPERPDRRWLEERLLRPIIYFAESIGRPLPACAGLFVSLFSGGRIHHILAAEVIAWACDELRTTTTQLEAQFGTHESSLPPA